MIGNLLWMGASLGLYAWLIWSVIYRDLSIGNFSLYLGSAATFFSFTDSLFGKVTELLARSREVDDFRSFMDIGDETENKGEKIPEYTDYEFTFEDVWFQYPGAESYALKSLNLTVKAGEKLAVVGLNGAGKSTFIKLLLRLYEPTKGRILLNGVDISKYERSEYYRLFSPVFQDVWMFAFPLKANVSMKDAAETDDEKVRNCLEDAGMKEALDETARRRKIQNEYNAKNNIIPRSILKSPMANKTDNMNKPKISTKDAKKRIALLEKR